MKTMKWAVLAMVAVMACLCSSFEAEAKTVVFVGGWRMNSQQMETFSKSVPGAKKFLLPDSAWELMRVDHCSDLLVEFLKKEDVIDEDLIFVAHSYGGVVTQNMLNDHPEVNGRAMVIVASPVGGYWMLPSWWLMFSQQFPDNLKVYAIAGSKGHESFLLGQVNDGTVDIESALSVPDKNLVDAEIIPEDHEGLLESPMAQQKIATWVNNEKKFETGSGNFAYVRK